MLDARAREALQGFQQWIGRALARAHLTADSLTALGVLVTIGGAWRIADGGLRSGGVILIVGGLLDFFDGAVAHARGTASRRGAFLDSVTDRLSDALIFSALAWHSFVNAGDHLMAAGVLAAYALAGLTSYIRAKAESLGFDCRVGLLERAERLIVLIVGLILTFLLEPLLWALVVLGTITVLQRFVHVYRQARAAA